MPVAKHRSPNLKWVFELPDKLKLAIADCVTLHSRIESLFIEILWEIEQPDIAGKKAIAKAWGDQNFKALKRVIKGIPGAQTDAIWPALKALGRERNIIGHGVWMWTNEERPMVIWHSKFLEEPDWVGAEFFDFTRFDHFLEKAAHLVDMFAKFKLLVVQIVEAEKARRLAAGEPVDAPVRMPWIKDD
jgi:hypothetical protein